jgi:hypothetical protein
MLKLNPNPVLSPVRREPSRAPDDRSSIAAAVPEASHTAAPFGEAPALPVNSASPEPSVVNREGAAREADYSALGPRQAGRFALHHAISEADINKVRALITTGAPLNVLDACKRSPLDLVDTLDVSLATRSALRRELLHSRNPSAPPGHLKPEAIHGSPWGFEILASGGLKAGANDLKGGAQSLEGMVFFSDRTPESASEDITRRNFRSKPRDYARGEGSRVSAAASRGFQYRMTQAILDSLNQGLSLDLTGQEKRVVAKTDDEAKQRLAELLQKILTWAGSFTLPVFQSATLRQMAENLKLPKAIRIEITGREPQVLTGDLLVSFFKEAAMGLKQGLENGQAPFLNLINEGRTVPMVFGFEKVADLKTHAVTQSGSVKNYSYQSTGHPLAGSAQGGKLLEIEVRSAADLATLCLGGLAKGVEFPRDVSIRIKSDRNTKAHYLSPAQFKDFQSHVADKAFTISKSNAADLMHASIEDLQTVNARVREDCPDVFAPVEHA